MRIFLRTFILLLMTCVSWNANALIWSNSLAQFKIPRSSNIQDYRDLVGRTLIYVPANDSNNHPLGNKLCKLKITAVNGKNTDKMQFVFQKEDESAPITINYAITGKSRDGYLRYPEFSFLDYDKWSDSHEYPSFTDPMVKGEYVVDHYSVVLEENRLDEYATLINTTINDKYEVKWTGPESANNIFDAVKKMYWEKSCSVTSPSGEKMSSEDEKYDFELFELTLYPFLDETGLNFTLTNKSNQPIILNWDRASFVNSNRNVSKVIHNGIKLIDKMAPQPPTMIPGNASLNDIMVPTDNIEYVNNNWKKKNLTDGSVTNVIGSTTVDFVFPLEINGKTEYYTVTLKMVKKYKYPQYLNLD